MATPRHMECRLGSSRLGGAEDRQYVSLRQLARARCRMRQGLFSLLGTWWRSNQGELDACRRELSKSLEQEAATSRELSQALEQQRTTSRELSEALGQQAATSQVLGIISSSPTDLEPVFETILTNATRLCEASYGTLWLCEGDAFRCAALH